jgi:hypothetical protein
VSKEKVEFILLSHVSSSANITSKLSLLYNGSSVEVYILNIKFGCRFFNKINIDVVTLSLLYTHVCLIDVLKDLRGAHGVMKILVWDADFHWINNKILLTLWVCSKSFKFFRLIYMDFKIRKKYIFLNSCFYIEKLHYAIKLTLAFCYNLRSKNR